MIMMAMKDRGQEEEGEIINIIRGRGREMRRDENKGLRDAS